MSLQFVPVADLLVVRAEAAALLRAAGEGEPGGPVLLVEAGDGGETAYFLLPDATAEALRGLAEEIEGRDGRWIRRRLADRHAPTVTGASPEARAVVVVDGVDGRVVGAWIVRKVSWESFPALTIRGNDAGHVRMDAGAAMGAGPVASTSGGDDLPAHAAPPALPESDELSPALFAPEPAETDEAAPAAAAPATLRRTPHLDAPETLPTTRGASFEVRVWADTQAAREGEESEDVLIEASPEIEEFELGVVLIAAPTCPLFVHGDYFKPVVIRRDQERSTEATFTVVVDDPDLAGDPELIAQFHYRGRPAGRVRRVWTRAGEPVEADPAAAGVLVHEQARVPDLTVVVVGSANTYTCHLLTPDGKATEPQDWPLPEATEAIVTRALDALVTRTNPEAKRQLALRAAGRAFWKAAPQDFQDALWRLLDERGEDSRPAVFIATDEPLLPWEIMLPSRPRPGAPDEELDLPLGAACAVGRWVRSRPPSPFPTKPIANSFLIAATYATDEEHIDASDELAILEEHFGGQRLEKGSFEWLDEHLESNSASLLHFVCHGAAHEDDAVLYLDGAVAMSSAQMRESRGFKAALAKLPVVFLNACDAGRNKSSLGPGGTGFPVVLTEMGARAIIAPLWPVTKFNAPVVAKEIYEQALKAPDRSIADVLAELRARSYTETPFDDSWAAYALFGDPHARLQRAT